MLINANQEYTVYKYTCTVTNKSYIGQTKNLKNRTISHKAPSSGCIALRNAIQKYGWHTFVTMILAENLTIGQANELEPKFIIEHNTLVPLGYNITPGGLNYTKSQDQKDKISQALKGRIVPPDVIAKRILKTKGVPQNPLFIAKRALANTGKTRTQGQRLRMSQSHIGKILSAEHRLHISIAHTGLKRPHITCPHCGTMGGGGAMHRWHFDNCNNKEIA